MKGHLESGSSAMNVKNSHYSFRQSLIVFLARTISMNEYSLSHSSLNRTQYIRSESAYIAGLNTMLTGPLVQCRADKLRSVIGSYRRLIATEQYSPDQYSRFLNISIFMSGCLICLANFAFLQVCKHASTASITPPWYLTTCTIAWRLKSGERVPLARQVLILHELIHAFKQDLGVSRTPKQDDWV